MMPAMGRFIYILFILIFFHIQRVEMVLELALSGRELQKMLFGSDDEIRVVKNGDVSNILKNNLTSLLPPIQPEYNEITIRFASEKRLYYHMYLSSSNESIMSMPTVTVPYIGRLAKEWIQFNIRFPCLIDRTIGGVVTMGIIMDFYFDKDHKHFFKRIDLSMKRACKKPKPPAPKWRPVRQGCVKRCDLVNLKRKFCLSDFVARVKVTEVVMDTEQKHYLVHVPRKRIFKKPYGDDLIKKRNQKILARGDTLTCYCQPLQVGRRYLVFGREDLNSNLYFDNYSIAFEVSKYNERQMRTMRAFRKDFRNIKCPRRLYSYYRRRSDYFPNRNNDRYQYGK